MKIVLLSQYYSPDPAPTGQLLSDLGASLATAGHDVHSICCNRSYADADVTYPRREIIGGVSVRRVWTTGFGRRSRLGRVLVYAMYLIEATYLLLVSRKPDVVVVLTNPPMLLSAVLIARAIRRFRVVLWSMDVYPELAFELGVIRRSSVLGKALRAAGDFSLRRADAVVALDEAMKKRLDASAPKRIDVIHSWADDRRPRAAPVGAFRDSRGWQGRFVVLYSGNFGLVHEFETVIAAAERLSRSDPRVLFAFAGSGSRLRELEAAAATVPNVRIYPSVSREELPDLLASADVHLVTLRPRMSGLVVPSKIYGVLAAGRPTIYVGPADGEVFSIVKDGCGAAVANGDVAGVVAAIETYVRDDDRCRAEGEAARRIFESRFTREQGTAKFRRLIESL